MFNFGGTDAQRKAAECPVSTGMGVATNDGHAGVGEALFRAYNLEGPLANVVQAEIRNLEVLASNLQRMYLNSSNVVRYMSRPVKRGYAVVSGGEY